MIKYRIKLECLTELTDNEIKNLKSVLREFLYEKKIYYENLKIIKIHKVYYEKL